MGELHLEILVDRMKREFRVEANVGKPQVAYRETIRSSVEKHDYTHKKQTGGSGQFAKVQSSTLEPTSTRDRRRRGATSSSTRSPVVASRASTSRRSTTASRTPWSSACSPATRWSDVKVTLRRRRLPRRRLLGAGVQDRRLDGLQGGRPQGRARAARADDGRRGDHARGLHGRRHRRHQLPPRPDPGHGGASAVPRSSTPWCRCRRCSGTSATCGPRPQGQASYSMEFDSYAEVPRAVAEEIIKKVRGE